MIHFLKDKLGGDIIALMQLCQLLLILWKLTEDRAQ